jgi:hypothetical protein
MLILPPEIIQVIMPFAQVWSARGVRRLIMGKTVSDSEAYIGKPHKSHFAVATDSCGRVFTKTVLVNQMKQMGKARMLPEGQFSDREFLKPNL